MPEATGSPLSDNAVGAIAYITPVPAIAFLVLVPYKKSSYVRFHAWQSIFLHFVALIIFCGLDYLLEVTGFVGVRTAAIITGVIWLIWTLMWILCVIKALNGNRFKLPLIGALAQRQAEG